jgi:uncharacterized protein YceK
MKLNRMQAVLAVVLVVGLLLSGCTTVSNAVTGAQQLLCNPTVDQQNEANAGITCANAILAILMAIPNPTQGVASLIISVGGAATVFKTIQTGGCVLATELSAAMAALDTAEQSAPANAASIAAASAKVQVTWPVIPPLPNLHNWVK